MLTRGVMAVLLAAPLAVAAPSDGAPVPGDTLSEPSPRPGKEAKKPKPSRLDTPALVVRGRVEARAGAADDELWARDYDARAILGADFHEGEWLEGQAELGLSALPSVRDVWLRAAVNEDLSLKVGRFRPPFGRLEQRSRWDMPVVRRGAVSNVAQDDLGYGGRRNGVEFKAARKSLPLKPAFSLGIFQGDTLSDGSSAEDLVSRVVVRPMKKLSLGAGVYARGAFREGAGDRWLLGFDAGWTKGALELVGELQAGPEFTGALALAAWRVDAANGWWVQPALSAEVLRVDTAPGWTPYVVPSVALGTGRLRGVAQVELGAGRDPVGATRQVGLNVIVGAEF